MSALQVLLDRAAGDERPWVEFLERSWSPAGLQAIAGKAAAGLTARGLKPGERLGLLLPNLPIAAAALLAAWRAGLVALPMDPRRPAAELAAWQARFRPAALVTLDLATVFERAAPLTGEAGCRFLIVARMADQLSWTKRLFSPWLRAGGVVRPPPRDDLVAWEALAGPRALDRLLPDEAPALELPDGTLLSRGELAALAAGGATAERRLLGLPLARMAAMRALMEAFSGGGALVLSPRLDERSLKKVEKAARTSVTIGSGGAEGEGR